MERELQERGMERLRQAVEQKVGRQIRTPVDFDWLALRMKEEKAETLSVSTLKRIWHYVAVEGTVRVATLSVLARFVGFAGFDDFCRSMEGESDFISSAEVRAEELHEGDCVRIAWLPDRMCLLRCLGDTRFVVMGAENAKLQPGDMFSVSAFRLHHPLYVTNLCREGCAQRDYVAASRHGLSAIILEGKEDVPE